MEEEDCCQSDALLVEVVSQAKAARQAIRCPYHDAEEAFTDGYVAGWFAGHFQRTPTSEPFTEPLARCEPNRTEQVNV